MVWWSERTGKQQLGYTLTFVAVCLTFFLSVLRSGDSPPSSGWVIFLTVLGITAQAASAFTFGQVGKAEPAHAQASVSHLWTLARRAGNMRKAAEDAFEQRPKPTPSELHSQIGILSSELSWIEEDALEAIEHWRLFHEQAVKKVEDKHAPKSPPTPTAQSGETGQPADPAVDAPLPKNPSEAGSQQR